MILEVREEEGDLCRNSCSMDTFPNLLLFKLYIIFLYIFFLEGGTKHTHYPSQPSLELSPNLNKKSTVAMMKLQVR